MKERALSRRNALWLFAAALVLKSAMPWVANLSAEWQGKSLVEICTVYGVSLVPLGDKWHGPMPDAASAHDQDHCALSVFAALAPPGPAITGLPPEIPADPAPPRAHPSSQAPDACATWVARLKHGPPTLS